VDYWMLMVMVCNGNGMCLICIMSARCFEKHGLMTIRCPPVQELLSAQLRPTRECLDALEGRWWKKRWSGDRANSALLHAVRALQVRWTV
jgi:hypothetical protein